MNVKDNNVIVVLLVLALISAPALTGRRAEAAVPAAQLPSMLYPNQRGPVVVGAGSPLLTYQADASLPVSVYRQRLPWGPRITVRSVTQGEIRFTLDGSRPTAQSRRYFGPFMHLRGSPIRVGVFAGTNLVTEAVAFPAHEMLAQAADLRLPLWRRQLVPANPPPALAFRDHEVLIEVNRELRYGHIIHPPPPPPPPIVPESTSSGVSIEVSRGGWSPNRPAPLPPSPPLPVTTPEDPLRIIAPPVPVGR